MKRENTLILLVVFLVIGFVGYDLSGLQRGFKSPEPDIVANAEAIVNRRPDAPAITSYDSFSVSVDHELTMSNIDITVYTRESDSAVANVLMIHGAAGGAWAWEHYFATFPDEFNLYALSWRGHFDSTPVDDANSADYVQDQTSVLNIINARNDLPVHLIGHSYGGATTMLQTAQMPERIASVHLLGPVVPLDYTPIQALLVPRILPPIIAATAGEDGQGASPFPKMFIAESRMQHYQQTHASKPYSVEKPGLLQRDAFAVAWQAKLDAAYKAVGSADLPVWIFIATYDNVVKRTDLFEMADKIGANAFEFPSGHYIQLDMLALESAEIIVNQLRKLSAE